MGSCANIGEGTIHIDKLATGTHFSCRAISAVDEDIIWASGTNSEVIRTEDGGRNWQIFTVADTAVSNGRKYDFRSLWTFGRDTAIVVTAGNPAIIFKTCDAGDTWKKVYSKVHDLAFYNSIAFKNDKEGVVVGDPIDGYFSLLYTKDGGESWVEMKGPAQFANEGCFAASNSCVTYSPEGVIAFVAGASRAAFHVTDDHSWQWSVYPTNIPCITSPDGIYSLFSLGKGRFLIGGGDYTDVENCEGTIGISSDGGKSWTSPASAAHGFVSCVKNFADMTDCIVAVGSDGVSYSYDGGNNWTIFSKDVGYHTLNRAPGSSIIWAAGSDGRVAKIQRSR